MVGMREMHDQAEIKEGEREVFLPVLDEAKVVSLPFPSMSGASLIPPNLGHAAMVTPGTICPSLLPAAREDRHSTAEKKRRKGINDALSQLYYLLISGTTRLPAAAAQEYAFARRPPKLQILEASITHVQALQKKLIEAVAENKRLRALLVSRQCGMLDDNAVGNS